MNLFRLLGIFLAGALPLFSSAQGQFKIIASYKNNQVLSPKAKTITFGDILTEKDSISIADSGYVALIHTSGTAFEFTQKGRYAVSDLKPKKIGNDIPPPVNFEMIDALRNQVGGVRFRNSQSIHVHTPEFTPNFVFKEKYLIDWDVYNPTLKEFKIRLIAEDEYTNLFDTLVKDIYSYKIDFSRISTIDKDPKTVVTLKISAANDPLPAPDYPIFIIDQNNDGKKGYEYFSEVEKFYNNVQNSAIENYLLGTIYQKSQMHFKAVQYFKKAYQMYPYVERYKMDYWEAAYLPLGKY